VKNWRGVGSWGVSDSFRGWLVQYCSECGRDLASYSPPHRDWPYPPGGRKPVPEWAEAYYAAHPEARVIPVL